MKTARDTTLSLSRLSINDGEKYQNEEGLSAGDRLSTTLTRNEEQREQNETFTNRDIRGIEMIDDAATSTYDIATSSNTEGKHTNRKWSEPQSGLFIDAQKSDRTRNITVNNNTGTVIVDINFKKPDVPTASKCSNDKDSSSNSRSINSIPSSISRAVSRKPVYQASQDNYKIYREEKRGQRRLRQTLIDFPRRKRKQNIKSVSGRVSDITEDVKHAQIVNVTVNDNSGQIIIGNDVTYTNETAGQDDGMIVEADGVSNQVIGPQRGPVFFIDENVMNWLNKFYRITNEIYPLRDNGRWDDFYRKVDNCLQFAKARGLQEEEIFLIIEKSVALSYQKRSDESKQMVKQAKEMILTRPGLKMKEFLVALSYCQLAALYRRERKLSKAKNAVCVAEQNVEFVPCCLSRAYVIYEKASNWFVHYTYFPQPDQDKDGCADEAKKEFKSCISTCEEMLSKNDTIYLRRHHFSLVKLALMNLNCGTSSSRRQPVAENNVAEAAECISRMVERYSGEMGESTNMLLCVARRGLSYRQGDYGRCEMFTRHALNKAESLGFKLEIQELQERLKEITLAKDEETS